MARDWEGAFAAWGGPPSDDEEKARRKTEAEILEALRNYRPLQDKKLKVYAKGSYRRGTNVRLGSDVDIAVELRGDERTGESFHYAKDFNAKDLSDAEIGVRSVPEFVYTVFDLKDDVHAALLAAYGDKAVKRSNKCIKIREKATTLPADVVPCRTYRRYDSKTAVNEGIAIHPDKGDQIINWPQQDDDNGTTKNTNTRLRYKRAVRGIKSLENEMVDKG